MKIYKNKYFFLLLIVFISFFTPLKAEDNEKVIKLKLILDWTPNTHHTGIIVAKKLGFYDQENITLQIIQPGKGSAEILLAKGLTDFAISSETTLIEATMKCLPLVSIATILAHNTSGFYSLKDKNILTPKDFEGKTYGSWGCEIEIAIIKAMMKEFGANFNKVKIVTIGSTDFFRAKNIDFIWGFKGWTGIEAKIKKIPVNYIDIRKTINLDTYTPIILTNKTIIKNQPDIISKFIKATTLGYNYAISYPEEAAKILLEEFPELNKELIVESQKFVSKQYKDPNHPWGYQDTKIWENYLAWLTKNIPLKINIAPNNLFTNKFIVNY